MSRIMQGSKWHARRHGRTAQALAACLWLILAVAGERSVSSAASAPFGTPSTVSASQARLHQLRSTADRSFTLIEYPVPTPNAVPHILAVDAQDHVWFSESGGRFARNFLDVPPQNKVGRLDQEGTISEWVLNQEPSSPMGILVDQAGDLWVTERLANQITRLRRDGGLDRYAVPTPHAWPTGIAVDGMGRIWFTETKGDKLGMVDPATGGVQEYPLPVPHAMATGLAVDRTGGVWVAERDANAIGRFDPDRQTFTQFPLPTKDAKPCGVAVDQQGTVWFTERNGGKLGKIGSDGSIQEYVLQDQFAGPFFAVADRRGDIWFSELFAHRIGRFSPRDRRFEHFPIPGEPSHPAGLAIDSKGNVWFSQQATNRIGLIVRTDLSYLAGEEAQTSRPAGEAGGSFRLQEFDIPTPQAIPGIVAVDRHDQVWFTQMGGGFVGPGFPPGAPGSKIGYIAQGTLHELATPTPESGPTSLAKDPCGDDIWITLRAANKIARVRDLQVTEYDIPVPDSLPVGIAVDLDHNVWVALSEANKIARRSPTGDWRVLDLPQPNAQPRTIYVDRWNQVWFAEKLGNHIGWVDQANWRVERWKIPTRLAWPLSLEADEAGNLWFAEMRSDKLGKLDRQTKTITEYALPVQSAPFKILYDQAREAFWISTVFGNAVLRFDLTGQQVSAVYPVPHEGAWVGGLDRDSQHCLWFSEQFANKIGRLCIDGVAQADSARTQATARTER